MNKGRSGGKLGAAKGGSRRAREKALQAAPHPQKRGNLSRKPATVFHPAGRGGPEQWAGGPEHHGGDASEDRNP